MGYCWCFRVVPAVQTQHGSVSCSRLSNRKCRAEIRCEEVSHGAADYSRACGYRQTAAKARPHRSWLAGCRRSGVRVQKPTGRSFARQLPPFRRVMARRRRDPSWTDHLALPNRVAPRVEPAPARSSDAATSGVNSRTLSDRSFIQRPMRGGRVQRRCRRQWSQSIGFPSVHATGTGLLTSPLIQQPETGGG